MSNLDGYDWSVVGRDGNPVPGDSGATSNIADKYAKLRDNFNEMADALSKLGTTSGMNGNWSQKFLEKSKDLPDDFRGFANGFNVVATELHSWSGELDSHQSEARKAIESAIAAQGTQQSNQQNAATQQQRVNSAKDAVKNLPADATDMQKTQAQRHQQQANDLLNAYNTKVNQAAADIDSAKQTIIRIKNDYDYDGDVHAGRIGQAQTSTPSVSGFEKVYYSDAWQIAVKVLEFAAIALAIASFFFGGWVLLLASVAVGVALALEKSVEYHFGDASLGEVIVETIFAGLSVATAFRPLMAVAKGLRGAMPAFKVTKLGNVVLNLGHVTSAKNFNILAKFSGFKGVKDIVGEIKRISSYGSLLKEGSALKNTMLKAVGDWSGAKDALRKGLYFAGRNHLWSKTAKAAQVFKPFMLDTAKYGEPTVKPEALREKFIPGWSLISNTVKGAKKGFEIPVYLR